METATQYSTDGLHWLAGSGFHLRGGGSFDDPGVGGGMVSGLVEGNGVILALAEVGVSCGTVAVEVSPLAVSRDGISWTPALAGLGSIQRIDGGSTGFIAAGEAGVFTSADGVAWRKSSLSGPAFKDLHAIGSGTAFAGGFVISGELNGSRAGGCAEPSSLRPSIWWSADGAAWSRGVLPGGIDAVSMGVDVCRLSDRELVATETSGDKYLSWSSGDGKSWKAAGARDLCGLTRNLHLVGAREMWFALSGNGRADIKLVQDNLTETMLTQSGDLPDWDNIPKLAFGPAGIIASDGQGTVYLGVPVAD